LSSSWDDLFDLWGSVIGNVEEAYRATAERTASYCLISLDDPLWLQSTVKHKLEAALAKLAGSNHVAGWDAQAVDEIKPLHASSGDMMRDEGEQDS